MAKFPLEQGEAVGHDNMALRDLPADALPGSAIRPAQFDTLAGLRLARSMRSGEPLLREALVKPDPEPLATRLSNGRRAVTVAVDEVNSVSGMLQPGDRIDLLLTVKDAPTPGQTSSSDLTKPLLQDLRILATGSRLEHRPENRFDGRLESRREAATSSASFATITVEVTPDQAKMLVLAQRGGRITALLRGPDDRSPIASTALDFNTLVGRERAQPPAHALPSPTRPSTEMIIGGVGRSPSAPAIRSEVPATPLSPAAPTVVAAAAPAAGPGPGPLTLAADGARARGLSASGSAGAATSLPIETPWGRFVPHGTEPLLMR